MLVRVALEQVEVVFDGNKQALFDLLCAQLFEVLGRLSVDDLALQKLRDGGMCC